MRLKLGIRGHDLPGAPFETLDDFVKSFKQFDLDYVQLVNKKAFRNFNMDPHFILESADKFKENGIQVAMVGAYFNMIHPDEEKRLDGVEYFKWNMEIAPVYNCHIIGSETGSANGDKWTYNEYNHTEEAYQRVKETVTDLKKYGKIFKTRPVIEGAYAHTVYKPELLQRLVDETEIHDVTIDVYNYLNIDNYMHATEIFDTCMDLFKDKIRIFHLKDFNVVDGKLKQCGISKGIMDWKYFISRIKRETPDAVLIMEGITGEDIQTSIDYIRGLENESDN